jgi:hypothetical protein
VCVGRVADIKDRALMIKEEKGKRKRVRILREVGREPQKRGRSTE